MTAFNAFVTSNEVHLFTDGAFVDTSNDKINGIASKVIPLLPYPAAVCASGPAFIPTLVAGALADTPSDNFDDLLTKFSEVVQRYMKKTPVDWGRFQVGLAGWSPKENAPVFALIKSFQEGDTPAFAPTRVNRHLSPPILGIFSFDGENPEKSGKTLLEKQRRTLCRVEGGRTAYVVGAFAQHTIVSRDSVTMRVIERWPDRFGERISPHARLAA